MFEYIRGLIRLRHELAPLRTGNLKNLYVSEQQYVYSRGDVIVALNNDDKEAVISVNTDLADNKVLHDRLRVSKDLIVRNRKLQMTLAKRSVSIFVED